MTIQFDSEDKVRADTSSRFLKVKCAKEMIEEQTTA